MPSSKYVCFTCREVKSVMIGRFRGIVRDPSDICPKCNGGMYVSNSQFATPKKSDDKAWKKWLATLQQYKREKHQKDHKWRCNVNKRTSVHVGHKGVTRTEVVLNNNDFK